MTTESCEVCWRSDGGHNARLHEQKRILDNLPEATVRPCNECPWLRTSVPGYLGPSSAEEWIEMAHGETPIACHMTIEHDGQDWSELRQCAGAAIFRANVCKTPRHPMVARAKPNTEAVFSWNDEFLEHHEGGF